MSVNGDNVICDFYKIILGDIMGYDGKVCKDCARKIVKKKGE